MGVRIQDIEAEEVVIRGMVHGVCHDEIFTDLEEKMLSGVAETNDKRPILTKNFFKLITTLRSALKSTPDTAAIRREIQAAKVAGVKETAAIGYFDRLSQASQPAVADVRSALTAVIKAYNNRFVFEALKSSANVLEDQGGTLAIEHLRQLIVQGTKLRKDDSIVVDYVDAYEDRKNEIINQQTYGVSTQSRLDFGIAEMDAITGGMGPGELIVGVAGTGRGKSIFMQDICAYLVETGKTAVYFTKEMLDMELGFRFDARFTDIKHPKFSDALLDTSELSKWDSRMQSLSSNSLKIVVVNRDFTVEHMNRRLDSMDRTFKPDIIFADYVNLMKPSEQKGRSSGWEDTSIVCEELKDLARDREVPVMTMAQLKPQSSEKNEITFDDIAVSKLGLTAHSNLVFAILADKYLRAMGQAFLQFLKLRSRNITKDRITILPDMDMIRMHNSTLRSQGQLTAVPPSQGSVTLSRGGSVAGP